MNLTGRPDEDSSRRAEFPDELQSFVFDVLGRAIMFLSRPCRSWNGRLEIQAVPPASETSQEEGSTPKKRIQFWIFAHIQWWSGS